MTSPFFVSYNQIILVTFIKLPIHSSLIVFLTFYYRNDNEDEDLEVHYNQGLVCYNQPRNLAFS